MFFGQIQIELFFLLFCEKTSFSGQYGSIGDRFTSFDWDLIMFVISLLTAVRNSYSFPGLITLRSKLGNMYNTSTDLQEFHTITVIEI